MNQQTSKSVALVTGGAQGIGYGIAKALAAEGMDLAIADIQAETDHRDAMDALRANGGSVLYCEGDISSSEDRSAMLAKINETYGKLNVLVNNAGVAPKVRLDLLEATEESYERVMRINLQGPYFLSQSVANWMIDQQKADSDFQGCIINVSSISATVVSIARGEYCVSKAGVAMMTKLFAVRLAEFNIPVYEIRPGLIKTPMTAGVREKYDKLIAEGLLPQKRWGTPDDVGKAAAMMARGDLPYSTGQAVNVDGGFEIVRL